MEYKCKESSLIYDQLLTGICVNAFLGRNAERGRVAVWSSVVVNTI